MRWCLVLHVLLDFRRLCLSYVICHSECDPFRAAFSGQWSAVRATPDLALTTLARVKCAGREIEIESLHTYICEDPY